MEADSGIPIKELRVDGGATANNLLMQIQANVLDSNVIRPKITETTALGAAYLAGLAVGFWKNEEELSKFWAQDRLFEPEEEQEEQTQKIIKQWTKGVKALQFWTEN